MHSWLLLIPWFKLEPLQLPLPFIGTLKLQPFGLLAGLAMLVGSHFGQRRAAQLEVSSKLMGDFFTYTTLFGLICAYVLNIVMYSPELAAEIMRKPQLLFERWYGLSSYGGFIGGTLTAWWFAQRRKASLLALGDAWCFALPFAWIFARLGCFSVHDHPGLPSDFFLAVDNFNGSGVARHDLGLYEALWSMPVALLFWLRSRQLQAPGYYLALLTSLYGPVRFALDFRRADRLDGGDVRYFGLTPAQYLSLLVTAIGLGFCLRLRVATQRQHA